MSKGLPVFSAIMDDMFGPAPAVTVPRGTGNDWMTMEDTPVKFVYDNGGRLDAGFKGLTGDCFVRAVAIASGKEYREVYDRTNYWASFERRVKSRRGVSNARTGVHMVTAKKVVDEIGAVWTPTMGIGTGTTVHVRTDELPESGRHVLRLSHHFAAYIDGELRDNHDCSRDGTRAVYGYWTF